MRPLYATTFVRWEAALPGTLIVRLPSEGTTPAGTLRGHTARSADPGVDVYLIDPLAVDEPLGALLATLDGSERRRLLTRRTAYSRRLFLASHVGLRRILAGYLGVAPASVEFRRRSDAAKPELSEALGSELQFNLSHTRGLAVVAVARARAVGVDVEWTGRRGDALALARRHFSQPELMRLERIAPGARTRELLRLWTRREAVTKLTGEGLPGALGREAARGGDPRARFELYDLVLPGVEHVGALAVSQAEVRCGGSIELPHDGERQRRSSPQWECR